MNWIDINAEEKPEQREAVLVWVKESAAPEIDRFILIGDGHSEFTRHYLHEVSHWMRVEAPAEEGQ